MSRFRLLAFDLDGVLVDTTPCHAEAFEELWRELGIEGPEYARIAGQKTSEVVAHYTAALKLSEAQIRQWTCFKQAHARELVESSPIVFADTEAALRAFRQGGVRMGLGTGSSRRTVDLVLRRFGWEGLFAPVVAAEDVRQGKPSAEVYGRLVELAGVDASETLVVEDSAAGIEAGLASGASVVCVRSGLHSPNPRFLGSLADLGELADSLRIGMEAPWRA